MNAITNEMFNKLLEGRSLILSGAVNKDSAEALIMGMLTLDQQSNEPITIYINSEGGEVYSMNAIIDTMNLIKSPVYTVVMGLAASAASSILLAGEKGHRYATPNATIMLHQPSGGAQGTSMDVDITIRQLTIAREKLFKFCADRTGQPIETIRTDLQRDKYFSAEEALEYGIIDVILTEKGGN